MKVNVNHPTFIAYLESINASILNNIKTNNYFSLSSDKKLGIQYMVLKMMKNSVKVRAKLDIEETKSFINLLQSKNVEKENYEFAQILKDLLANFEEANDYVKPVKKTKTIRLDKKQNDE